MRLHNFIKLYPGNKKEIYYISINIPNNIRNESIIFTMQSSFI